MFQRRPGFTFVEILMVMIVMALVFAIAFPKLTVLRARSNVDSTMQRVASTIATARQSAIARGTPVKFGVAGDAVFAVAFPYGAADSIQHAFDVQATYGTTLGGDEFEVVFDPRGLAAGFQDKKSVIVTYGGRIDTLCVQKLGRVQMRDC
jgi:type II secretion system protein H